MKMHFDQNAGLTVPCGRSVYRWSMTTNAADVTCIKCQKSEVMRSLAAKAVQYAESQQILDIVAEVAYDEAKERGYCSQFEVVMQAINQSLPGGLRLSKPTQVYAITLHVKATDVDDAYSIINDNGIDDYVNFTEVIDS